MSWSRMFVLDAAAAQENQRAAAQSGVGGK